MQAGGCFIDGDFLSSYASFYYNWLLISVFKLGIPVILYIAVVMIFIKIMSRFFKESDSSKINPPSSVPNSS
jgi:uncharacterized membrane protein YGL010W